MAPPFNCRRGISNENNAPRTRWRTHRSARAARRRRARVVCNSYRGGGAPTRARRPSRVAELRVPHTLSTHRVRDTQGHTRETAGRPHSSRRRPAHTAHTTSQSHATTRGGRGGFLAKVVYRKSKPLSQEKVVYYFFHNPHCTQHRTLDSSRDSHAPQRALPYRVRTETHAPQRTAWNRMRDT